MSLVNTQVKPFTSTAFHNGAFLPVSDADLQGSWSIVFFYPADFTFVCPTELGDLAVNQETFDDLGVKLYSVSTDTHFTHKAWHDSSPTIGKICYPMIGDPTLMISRNFEVLRETQGLADRGTFTMDPAGVIQSMEGQLRRCRPLRRRAHPQGESCAVRCGSSGRGMPRQVGRRR